MAYLLALPPNLASVHDVFHVSMLRKYVHDPSHVVKYKPLDIFENLIYEEKLVKILDRKEQVLQNRVILLLKVLWRNHAVEEEMWDVKMRLKSSTSTYSNKCFILKSVNFGDVGEL